MSGDLKGTERDPRGRLQPTPSLVMIAMIIVNSFYYAVGHEECHFDIPL